MKHAQNKWTLLFVHFIALPLFCYAQGTSTAALQFEVNKILPYISLTEGALQAAQNLSDLNKRYQSSWVREYISVEVLASQGGKQMTAISKNDILTPEQRAIINKADLGSTISVKVKYMPENTLKQNDAKEINFTFTIDPKQDAKYIGGEKAMNLYFKENGIDKLPAGSLSKDDLVVINFTINEQGQIIDAHTFESAYQSFQNTKVEDILLKAICNMPGWIPASYSNGTHASQEFVLTVGNMDNCLIGLINIDTSEVDAKE